MSACINQVPRPCSPLDRTAPLVSLADAQNDPPPPFDLSRLLRARRPCRSLSLKGKDGNLLSLGALTGAGMFVGTVVAGSVMEGGVAGGGCQGQGQDRDNKPKAKKKKKKKKTKKKKEGACARAPRARCGL